MVAPVSRYFKARVEYARLKLPRRAPPRPLFPGILGPPLIPRYGHQHVFKPEDF